MKSKKAAARQVIRYSTIRHSPKRKAPTKKQHPKLYKRAGVAGLVLGACLLLVAQLARPKPPVRHNTGHALSRPQQATKLQTKRGQIEQDIPYCHGRKLDMYYPRVIGTSSAPVVVYLHGGGWEINNKASERDQLALIDGLRDVGIGVVSIDYRKMPDFYFPAPVEDTLCAIRYLRANAARYGIDSTRIGLHGFSAGGYLAAMAGTLDDNSMFDTGVYPRQSSRVQAVSTLAGLLDFEGGLWLRNERNIARFLHGASPSVANPITYVSADDPPFLLMHGVEDQYVPVEQDDNFAAKLAQKGVAAKSLRVEQAEHGLNHTSELPMAPTRKQVSVTVVEFFKAYLNTPPAL